MCSMHDKCTCLGNLRKELVTVKNKCSYDLKTEEIISKDEKLYKAGVLVGIKKAVGLVDDALYLIGRVASTKGLK